MCSHHHRSVPRRNSNRLVASLAAVLVALATPGCQEPTSQAVPPPPKVGVIKSYRMTIPVLATPNGTTRALQEVIIRARVRGFLTERHFEEGETVKEGQLLLVIDEEQYKIALESAEASKAEAEAALKKAQVSKVREVSAAQLALSRAQLLLAQIQERRAKTLLARNAGSREDLDKAEADRQRWEAQVEADQANSEQAKADYDVGIAAAQAQVKSAQAAVRDAELNLGYCRMYAPIDGRIGEAIVKVGNLVGPDAAGGGSFTELATIQLLDPMGIDIQVSSRYLDRATRLIKEGLNIRVFRPGLHGEQEHPEEGVCYFIDNMVNPTTSTFLTKARVPNPQGSLLPGEYVKLQVVVDRLENAVVVPAQAVMETESGPVVYFVDDQGKVAVQSVEAAQTYQGLRVIMKGIDADVPVIVEGLQLIRPGAPVRAEPAVLPRPSRELATEETPKSVRDELRKDAAPGSDRDETKEVTPKPTTGQDAAKASVKKRFVPPVVQPGGPGSAVVESLESKQADRPAPAQGEAPK